MADHCSLLRSGVGSSAGLRRSGAAAGAAGLVGVLMPSAGTRLRGGSLRGFRADPVAARVLAPPVR
eukprot:15449344-Alexandrium_andersonii.AAC.1